MDCVQNEASIPAILPQGRKEERTLKNPKNLKVLLRRGIKSMKGRTVH